MIETKKTIRELAYQIVFEFEQTKRRLDQLESKFLSGLDLSLQDKRFLKQLCSGAVRHLTYLDWIIARFYHGRMTKMLDKTKTILRLGLFEIIFLEKIPDHATVNEYVSLAKKKIHFKQGMLVNAVLRNYLRKRNGVNIDEEIEGDAERIHIRHSFPLWLVKWWIDLWGMERTRELCKAFNREPDFDIYINAGKISTSDMGKILIRNAIEFKQSYLFEEVFRIKDTQKLIQSGVLQEGLCSVQDESAHIPVELLNIKENDLVLDMCAAPGGKYLQILQEGKKSVFAVASDIDASRIKRIKTNLKRLNLNNGYMVVADGRHLPFKPVFTKILLDAPCSGLGVIRKHPDIKWRRNEEDIQKFALLQSELIRHAVNFLKDGGSLVYSTCTIDPMENEQVIKKTMKDFEGHLIRIEPEKHLKHLDSGYGLRTFPDTDNMDGSYCIQLRKK